MNLDELLKITDGKLISNYKNVTIKNFSLDTRITKKSDCFIALKGNKYDANDFINDNYKLKMSIRNIRLLIFFMLFTIH